MMSPAYRTQIPLERFTEKVEANPYLTGAQSIRIYQASGVRGGMKAKGYLSSSAGTVEVVFHYTELDDSWYVVGLTIAGAPALAH